MKKLLFILLVIHSGKGFGQGENNIWHFGYYAGLDFNSGSPVSINGGQTAQREGVACVSDATGNLLFYSDGVTVWDKTHNIMPNGAGLKGDASSTHSATIIPVPGIASQYYLFTCPEIQSGESIYYSILDMTLNGGNGDVTAVKNIALLDSATEQCTVIPGVDGCLWLVARKFTPFFYAWLIDPSGIQAPVISNCGTPISNVSSQGLGYMKASPLNNKIGVAYYGASSFDSFLELYDFDNASGVVSNAFQLTIPTAIPVYSCAFSPDGSKFYGAEWGNNIFQYDMNAGSQAAIQASQTLIGTAGGAVGAMQIGPDMKIYVSPEGLLSLSVIDDPNMMGVACNFLSNVVPLGGNSCAIGLPAQVLLPLCNAVPNAIFNAPNHICPGTCTNFINNSTNATSYIWSFPGGSPSVSTDQDPANICYITPGQYDVSLIATNANGSDTLLLTNFITVYPFPAPQGILQSGDTLFANAGSIAYQWFHNSVLIPGATDYFYVAPSSGNYNVVVTDANGCEVEAVINDVIAENRQLVMGNLQLAIFPNPVSEILEIRNLNLEKKITIEVYSILGTAVPLHTAHCPLPTCSLDVSALSTGIYWLSLSSDNMITRIPFIKK